MEPAGHRATLKALEAQLGVSLTLDCLGSSFGIPGRPGWCDYRTWSVCIGKPFRSDIANTLPGPWSHRASGLSYPATTSWSTDEFPTPDKLAAMVRERAAQSLGVDLDPASGEGIVLDAADADGSAPVTLTSDDRALLVEAINVWIRSVGSDGLPPRVFALRRVLTDDLLDQPSHA